VARTAARPDKQIADADNANLDLADGEALIFAPDGKGGATMVARVKIEEWPQMQF